MTCTGGVIKGNIGTGREFTITAYRTGAEPNVITDCVTDLSQIDRIKSVGSYKNTSRAVEMAVAADDEFVGCNACHFGEDKLSKKCSIVKNGENICEDENGCQLYVIKYNAGKVVATINGGQEFLYQQSGTHNFAMYTRTGTNGDTAHQKIWDPENYFEVYDDEVGVETDSDNIVVRKEAGAGITWDLVVCD
jgi:hypothetical protein